MTSTPKKKISDAESYGDWGRRIQCKVSRQNVLAIARSHLVTKFEELDADPMLLNVKNGTLDLRTGQLHEHNPADLLTMMAGCDFLKDSPCPTWEEFLSRVLAADPELISYVQKVVGYCLTGVTTEQVFFVLYGTGANGKSTFVGILSEVLGDYAKPAPPGLLMAKKNEGHPTELASLFRARFVPATEVNAGAQWDESKAKMLTGGDSIMARRMNEDFWYFSPSHKLLVCVNHQPETRDNSIGFWRRFLMVPFTVRIPAEEQDPHLMEKLRGELPGILAWAVRGCLSWQQHGLGTSRRVTEATNSYRHHQDLLGRFLEDCCDLGGDLKVQAQELFSAYTTWARINREPDLSQKVFGERIRERGFQTKKVSSVFYLGLGLKDAVEDREPVPLVTTSLSRAR